MSNSSKLGVVYNNSSELVLTGIVQRGGRIKKNKKVTVNASNGQWEHEQLEEKRERELAVAALLAGQRSGNVAGI